MEDTASNFLPLDRHHEAVGLPDFRLRKGIRPQYPCRAFRRPAVVSSWSRFQISASGRASTPIHAADKPPSARH